MIGQFGHAKMALLIISIAFVIPGTIFVTKSNRFGFQDSQRLEVKSVKWQPGFGELRSHEVLGHRLTDEDINRLRALGLKGSVTIAGSGIYGSGPPGTNEGRPHAYVLIVLQRPVNEPVNLDQPDRTNVIYVQTDEGWRMYPSSAKTLQRKIRLSPDPRDPESATLYMVDHADGSRQGGTLVTW